jgi:hypothetical protein
LRNLQEIATFREHWELLCSREKRRVIPDFDDILRSLREARTFALVVQMEGGTPICIACFVQANIICNFAIGKRHLWSICTDQIYLVGEVVLGKLEPDVWQEILRALEKLCKFEFLNLGEIPVSSDLFRAATVRSIRYRASQWSSADNVRWRAELPEHFEIYISSLRHKTRQMVRQALRKTNDIRSFQVFTTESQVDEFLSLAVAINKETYQWILGLRLKNDDAERLECIRQARQGQLRCYILRINGVACAFIRGALVRNMYLYQASGFLPQYAKWSPGKIALTLAIKDLVETGCKVFDFGDVGDQTSYKSRFGNACIPSRRLLLSKRFSVRPTLIAMAHRVLLELKGVGKRIFARGGARRGLRRNTGGVAVRQIIAGATRYIAIRTAMFARR